jgi:type VI secretion system secreted protein VgrG
MNAIRALANRSPLAAALVSALVVVLIAAWFVLSLATPGSTRSRDESDTAEPIPAPSESSALDTSTPAEPEIVRSPPARTERLVGDQRIEIETVPAPPPILGEPSPTPRRIALLQTPVVTPPLPGSSGGTSIAEPSTVAAPPSSVPVATSQTAALDAPVPTPTPTPAVQLADLVVDTIAPTATALVPAPTATSQQAVPTPSPSATIDPPTATPTAIAPSPLPSPTLTPTATPVPSPTFVRPTATSSATAQPSATPEPTETPQPPTATATFLPTATPTATAQPSLTWTPAPSATGTTVAPSPTSTRPASEVPTPTATEERSPTPEATRQPTQTPNAVSPTPSESTSTPETAPTEGE